MGKANLAARKATSVRFGGDLVMSALAKKTSYKLGDLVALRALSGVDVRLESSNIAAARAHML